MTLVVAAATQILDRGYGRPVQSIDANITDGDGPVRYYAELPKKAESPEAWLQSLGRATDGGEPDTGSAH